MAELGEPQVLAAGFTFLEAPRWHRGRLWFSDFYDHKVLAVDESGRVETVVEVPKQPSGLGWTREGALLIVSMLDKKLMRFDGGALKPFADLGGIATGPCNDMVVDAKGRAYVGNFGYDRHNGEAPRNAAVARVDPDGSVHVAAEDLAFPNGSVITPDGKTLIVAETFGSQLTAFDIAADGSLSNRRTFAAMGQTRPDGICLDAEGAVWVADAGGGRAVRVREGGAIADTISLSPRHAYACMLGGNDGKTLFILTSSASGPANAAKRDARVETVRVSVPHAGLP
jgi:sugar lactone lactonase YvrE